MRQQKGGLIINISSLGGLAAIPFQGYYSASKFAIEGFSEALRMEVKPFGIRVALVEPGDFATGFTDSRRIAADATGSVYEKRFRTALAVMERDERGGPDPAGVAQCIAGIIRTQAPGLRHPVGLRGQTLGVALKRVLPYALFEDGVLRHFGLR
jgi:NAD(P)-dependent dehydrogenase (short-subunit alcohol dehydrogenase family)